MAPSRPSGAAYSATTSINSTSSCPSLCLPRSRAHLRFRQPDTELRVNLHRCPDRAPDRGSGLRPRGRTGRSHPNDENHAYPADEPSTPTRCASAITPCSTSWSSAPTPKPSPPSPGSPAANQQEETMGLVSSFTRRLAGGRRTISPGPTSSGVGSPTRGGGGIGRIVGRLTGRGRRL